MRGTKALTPWMTPQRLTSRIHRHSLSSNRQVAPMSATPALLQRTSAPPKRSQAVSARRSTSSKRRTSVTAVRIVLEDGRFSDCAAESRRSAWTSAMTRCMPCAARRSQSARPIPLAAPVTTATLPLRSSIRRSARRARRCHDDAHEARRARFEQPECLRRLRQGEAVADRSRQVEAAVHDEVDRALEVGQRGPHAADDAQAPGGKPRERGAEIDRLILHRSDDERAAALEDRQRLAQGGGTGAVLDDRILRTAGGNDGG